MHEIERNCTTDAHTLEGWRVQIAYKYLGIASVVFMVMVQKTALRMEMMCPLWIENGDWCMYRYFVTHLVEVNFTILQWPLPINNEQNFLLLFNSR